MSNGNPSVPLAASAPKVGAARDALRTLLGFGVVWGLTKVVGHETATELAPQVEVAVVVAVSALLAWAGKFARQRTASKIAKVV